MAWNPKSRHWCVERQSGSGAFAIWPLDPDRTIAEQGISSEIMLTDLTWAEASTYARQWNALRDFAQSFSMGLGASGLTAAYERGVEGGYFEAVEPVVDFSTTE